MSKAFAPNTPKNEQGWYLFPRDIEARKKLFPIGVFQHPAKNNLFLIQELVRYLTKPEETILDPFAGTGTLIGVLESRHAVLIELEPAYLELINEALNTIPHPDSNVIVLPGDCRLVLPIPCDHAIFSPPFSTSLNRSVPIAQQKESLDTFSTKAHPLNFGRLNPFNFKQALVRTYQKLFESVRSGGSVAILMRDWMEGKTRVFLSESTIRAMSEAGFDFSEWYKWQPPGSAQQKINMKAGYEVIRDEDILIFRKP